MPAEVIKEKCDGCGTCQDNCPSDAIHIDKEDKAEVDPVSCIDCNLCEENCPQKAIEMKV